MHRQTLRVLVARCLPVLIAIVPLGCDAGEPKVPPADISRQLDALAKAPDGLDLRLSQGKPDRSANRGARLAAARSLSDDETANLLARLPAAEEESESFGDIVLRPATEPPPRTGDVVRTAFPPPAPGAPPPERNAQPLEVLRWMPEGEVALARELTVVFNQPMIPLTTHEAAAATLPVRVTPQPPGQWRWVDTRTVQFRPDRRFPHATIYTVEIAAGTKSIGGAELSETRTFRFETPPLLVDSSYPNGSGAKPTSVPIVIRFDQNVEPARLFAHVKLTANGEPLAARILTDAELAEAEQADSELAAFMDATRKAGQLARLLALRSERELPKDAAINIEISAGAPSAEGPGLTRLWQHAGFRTYAPLRILSAGCSSSDCDVDSRYSVRFNNALDPAKFDEKLLEFSPAIPGLDIDLYRDTLHFQGSVRPRTNYDVKLSARLADVHGQTLGNDEIRKWKTGDAPPSFRGPYRMTVLEPRGKPALEVFSRGYARLSVKIYRVEPKDYPSYVEFQSHGVRNLGAPPGTLVRDEIIDAVDAGDEIATTPIDLSAAMFPDGVGHAIAVVHPEPIGDAYRVATWVQSTRIGLDASVDSDGVVVFATDLATGRPAGDVEVTVEPGSMTGRTGDSGILSLPMPRASGTLQRVLARRGNDTAILSAPSYGWYSYGRPMVDSLAWYVADDRGTYRPGEEVTLKGWLRTVDTRKHGDVGAVQGVDGVDFVVYDALRVRMAEGSTAVSATGSFDLRFLLPGMPNLGAASVELRAKGSGANYPSGSTHTHRVNVREFRRPEYEVSAVASDGPHMIGDSADVTVRASYFAGGALAQAPVRWLVSSRRARFVPPGREDYEFGNAPSWWGYHDYYRDADTYGSDPEKTWNTTGVTDATGTHVVHLDLPTARPAIAMQVSAEAEVKDVNHQAWKGATTLLVHPADLYVGVRIPESYVQRGTTPKISVIGVDRHGAAAVGAGIEVAISRTASRWDQVREVDPQRCFVVSGEKPSTCTFEAAESGSYKVVATIVDAKGRPSQTESSFWVSRYESEPSRDVEQEKIELLADRKEYKPGDRAELSVSLPFYPAEAVVTVRRSGILETRRLTVTKPTTIDIEITDVMLPNVFVQVDAVGSVARPRESAAASQPPPRPAYATGVVELAVPPKLRTLDVSVRPEHPKLAPASETSLVVEVRDADGTPVAGAEAAVFVVDEAVLAIAGHRLPDPMGVFYPKREDGAEDLHSREDMVLKEEGVGGAYGELEMAEESPGSAPPLFLRKDFQPLAAFFPSLVTDASGKASASFRLPDSVTRYRIFAVAASGWTKFGKGESTITARLPLMARPSAPRFLNFGDVFELPVVVQNQTDAEATVRVALRTHNLVLTSGAGREVTIPANDRVEVRFPAAAGLAGKASFEVVALSNHASDAAAGALPIWTPATTEAFATYGVIDEGAVHQPVSIPDGVWPTFGELEVTTASTNLQALTDAFLYIVAYPYDCGEQIASRMLAIVALQDVLSAFRATGMPDAAQLRARIEQDVAELARKQKLDGGFVFWTKDEPSDAFLSVHATNALARSRARGVAVPDAMLASALTFLRSIETFPARHYTDEMRHVVIAYALSTRALLGDADVPKARKLIEDAGGADKLPVEAAGWLLGALAGQDVPEKQALVRHLLNRVSETAGAASFAADYVDENRVLLSSNRRTDAIVLDALIQAQPDLDLIPRLVTGLLAHRKQGRWASTQENVFVLLALDRYFRTYEKVEPDFVARLWLGNDYAGDHSFRGRTTESHAVRIPTGEVAARDGQSLVIQKDGHGRLYYRAGLRFAPRNLAIAAADHGFVVERQYEGADDAADVKREADGSWKMRLGSRVRVRLRLFNQANRYHVALVDPLPAGLEALAPETAAAGSMTSSSYSDEDASYHRWWSPRWFQHQNLRDERAEAFSSLLWPGDHVYEYLTRATTPGTFVVPPAKAEEMYMPETFGRTASTRVIVE